MSDPTQADQSAETAQGAVEPASSHPWGDDFQPDRAWQAIQNGRQTEKELKERLQSEQSVWDDENALLARIAEKYPHLIAEEDEDDIPELEDEDDDPVVHDPRVDDLLAWREEQQVARAQEAFDQHYNELAAAAKQQHGVDLPAEMFAGAIVAAAMQDPRGLTRDTTEETFSKLVEWAKAQKAAEQPQVPSPPPTGRQGAIDHKPGDRNSRRERIANILASQQTQQ